MEFQKSLYPRNFVLFEIQKAFEMDKMISVKEVMRKCPELESILGLSEARLEDLVTNGELKGQFDPNTGELIVDRAVMDDLTDICYRVLDTDEEVPDD